MPGTQSGSAPSGPASTPRRPSSPEPEMSWATSPPPSSNAHSPTTVAAGADAGSASAIAATVKTINRRAHATMSGTVAARSPLYRVLDECVTGQRPCQTGSRFSANAVAPSRASSEPKTGPAISAWLLPGLAPRSSRAALRRSASRRSTRERRRWRDRGGQLERGVDAPPGSASRLTRPTACARSASIGSPVSASSIARWYGIRRGRRISAPPAATSAALDLGDAEAGVARGDDQVADERDLEAAGDGEALDRRDQRLRGGALRDPGEAAVPDVRALAGDERLQVHAGAERAAGAGEHADPQLVVAVELVERGGHARRPARG